MGVAHAVDDIDDALMQRVPTPICKSRWLPFQYTRIHVIGTGSDSQSFTIRVDAKEVNQLFQFRKEPCKEGQLAQHMQDDVVPQVVPSRYPQCVRESIVKTFNL